ncbi:MAG: ADP-ribosylation factor-like protein [Archangium sp.]|nr:ADP-ribosylation factor-like protein [Archangium sp.]MDP3569060.1 ADP-ribosylation factor-like protein [Archangium sp.]
MSTVNVMAREIAAKIVFYGPGLSGKTTTLKRIYETVKPSLRGELMTLPTEADRTLFFDFLPVRVERVGDYALRLALYTVPGQVFYNATRKLVLQGSDGVVFVADSNPGAQDANRESMANLEENLAEQGIALDSFPLVIQFNKRDLGNAVPLAQMRALLNRRNVPDFETVAMSGDGVLDAMKAMIRLVIKDLRARKIVPSSKPRPSAPQPSLSKDLGASLEAQVQEHLVHQPAPEPLPAPHGSRPALGPVAALAPAALIDPARVAETYFAAGDFEGCVRTCLETLQRGLAFAGESSIAHQSFLLGLNGRDVLDAYTRSQRGASNIEDASFALFVLAQLFVRLTQAGLPTPEQ